MAGGLTPGWIAGLDKSEGESKQIAIHSIDAKTLQYKLIH